jgi:DNA-binding SARP family transcriptional activator
MPPLTAGYAASVTLRISVLGPLEARLDGTAVALRGSLSGSVLALLAMHPNVIVRRDAIIDTLWTGRPPDSSVTMIQSAIGRLRRLLDPEARPRAPGGLLECAGGGYRLRADPAGLDLLEFREIARQAHAALRQGDLAGACDLYEGSLSLWRGEPLTDIQVLREHPAVTGLAQEHADVVERYAEAAMGSGRHEHVLPALRALAGHEPLRERVHARLMLALAGSGQQAAALEVYDKLRRRLDDQLGVQPGTELAAAHARVLRGEVPAAANGAARMTGQVRPATWGAVPRQLPAWPRHFVGRADELAELSTLLNELTQPGATMVVSAIDGMAGIGKTALAVHWAHRVAEHFPDGQLYANLRGFDAAGPPAEAGAIIRGFLEAFGVPPERIPASIEAQEALYRSVLAGKRVLVVLDNASDADQVRPLLPGSAGCLVLVTSRHQLLSLVAAEGARRLVLDVLSDDDAADLLARFLGGDRAWIERAAVDDLVRLCGRLPLALRIVAARAAEAPAVPLRELVAQVRDLDTRLDTLTAGDPATDVRTVLSWSVARMTGLAVRIFELLGLHPGPDVSAHAAASLAGVSLAEARSGLAELAAAHLLGEPVPGRFAFHDLIRAYAAERASGAQPRAEREAAIHRAECWYLLTASAARSILTPSGRSGGVPPAPPLCQPLTFAGYQQALAWCDSEYANLAAVTSAAELAGHHDAAARLPAACWDYLKLRKPATDWVAFARLGIRAARRAGDIGRESAMLNRLGSAYHELRRAEEAAECRREALRIRREIGDREGEGATLNNLGTSYLALRQFSDAVLCFEQALAIAREVGDRLGETIATDNLGEAYQQLMEPAKALACHRHSLAVARDAQDKPGEGNALTNLAKTHLMLGESELAHQRYQEALIVRRESGDRNGEAKTLAELGSFYQHCGDQRAARRCWQDALILLDELGHPDADRIRRALGRGEEGHGEAGGQLGESGAGGGVGGAGQEVAPLG